MNPAPVTILVLNGPNLNRLGTREPHIYGTDTLTDVLNACAQTAESLGLSLDARQSDDEATLISWVHEATDARMPIIINPAAFTHYSYALRDALAAHPGPSVEVHLSNPAAREDFRATSVISPVVSATIAGLKADSYSLAVRAVASLLAQ
ncbi:MAG: type II 3-dehydroquinate dehydratase [Actinomycetes bacterium]|jgi:3-dehydroquinate dehydratase II|nr:3-dehydroquinate dehydratase [Candidatus Nanopelagicales bacterium]MDP4825937.1 3-dehydroquinate dehydratase [Candidatus Nanopelagicales bacterium]MDP4888797.1 3-dehydroquinate dehydratase [Candidatus Nanopelagicales bacterium]